MAQKYLVPEGSSFDSKAGILIAADGILVALLFGRSSLILAAPRILATAVVVLVGLSLVLGLTAFANRRYRTAPHPAAVLRLMAAPEPWLKWRFLGNLQEALRENEGKLNWKARLLSTGLLTLIVAVILLGAYFTQAIISGVLR